MDGAPDNTTTIASGRTQEPETLSATEEARDALSRGWQPIPMLRGSKHPMISGWPELIVTPDTFEHHFNGQPQNVAILTGAPSGGLIDLDLDHPLALRMAPNFLPPTGRAYGRASKPWSHRLYQCDPPPPTAKFQIDTIGMIVELRSTGIATMWPGSQHPQDEDVVWHARDEPAWVDGAELTANAARLAAAVLLVQNYPSPGGRDAFKLPLVGALLRLGWTDEAVRHFVLTVATAANDDEPHKRISSIEATRQRLLDGKPVSGWKALGDVLNDKPVVRRIRTWLDPVIPNQAPERWQRVEDFYAYLPERKYIFVPTRSIWAPKSVQESVAPVIVGIDDDGEEIWQSAPEWLDRRKPVHQMTWAPGLPQLIEGRVLDQGGWVERADLRAFNHYRAPTITLGDPEQATRWIEHACRLYPEDADHVIAWLAHRVQRPHDKINHALVLGGEPGIGKDTILTPVKEAVGTWNVKNISPKEIMGRFSGFVKSVILHINEAHDLGDVTRYGFYERMKAFTASPPETLLCDEKFVEAYPVLNVCGVVYTTNSRNNALYLPPNDRRHYVAWSECQPEHFDEGYFAGLYRWFNDEGGNEHVTAYLAAHDLSMFDAKAPPPKTRAFWALVNSNQTPEDAELADVLDALDRPDAVTIAQIVAEADRAANERARAEKTSTGFERMTGGLATGLGAWLRDRKNARQVPHRMEGAGYVRVDNPAAKDGVWRVVETRTVIYAKKELAYGEQLTAAERLVSRAWEDRTDVTRD